MSEDLPYGLDEVAEAQNLATWLRTNVAVCPKCSALYAKNDEASHAATHEEFAEVVEVLKPLAETHYATNAWQAPSHVAPIVTGGADAYRPCGCPKNGIEVHNPDGTFKQWRM